MSITFPYRSDLGLRGSVDHPRNRSDQLQVPPELAEALEGGPLAATRALRQLLATNGVPLSVGAGDAELAMRAQQQQWPDQFRDQILKLCALLLEAVLLQRGAFQQRPGGQGAEPSARHRAHAFDGERLCRHIARKIPEPAAPAPAAPTPAPTPATPTPVAPTPAPTPAAPGTPMGSMSGVDLANHVNDFSVKEGRKPEYIGAVLDPKVATDAKSYVDANPELKAAADRMLGALGPMPPGKADRWVTDFALDHYATEGKAKGQTWPSGTSAQVDKMIAAPQPGVDPKEVKLPYVTISEKGRTNAGVLTEYNTAGRENVSFGAGVSAGTHTVVNVDGKGNKVDFCSSPYPSPNGRGDAILGGTNCSGQADLTGTVLVRAGQGNQWVLKDPSQREALNGPDASAFQRSQRDQLATQAKGAQIVLEGNAADWKVRTDAQTSTYTNAKTGTSVQIPASAQGQVRYLDGKGADALAEGLRAGEGAKVAGEAGATPAAPTRTPAPPAENVGGAKGAAESALARSSVPYDQLPARMKGGISPDNGMPTIILRDAKELDLLPMWAGMHPDAAKSYRQRLSDALQTEGGSVMGFAGYQVEVVGTDGKERSRTPPKPYVSDAQIKDFVTANLKEPGKIAEAMKEHGVSFDRIQAATGYSRKQIVDFVMASSNKALIDLL